MSIASPVKLKASTSFMFVIVMCREEGYTEWASESRGRSEGGGNQSEKLKVRSQSWTDPTDTSSLNLRF